MDDNEDDDDVADGVEIEEESEMEEDSEDDDDDDALARNSLNEQKESVQTYAQYPSALQSSHNLKPPSVVPLNPPQLSPPRSTAQLFGSQAQLYSKSKISNDSNFAACKNIVLPVPTGKGCGVNFSGATLTRSSVCLKKNSGRTGSSRSFHPFVRPVGAALRVMPPKKRIKLNDDDEKETLTKSIASSQFKASGFTDSKSSVVSMASTACTLPTKNISNMTRTNMFKLKPVKNEIVPTLPSKKVLTQKRTRDVLLCSPKNKSSSKLHKSHRRISRFQLHVAQKKNEYHLADAVSDDTPREPAFLDVQFKRLKKFSSGDQFKRKRHEGKLDLMTPDSVISSCNIKDILSRDAFDLLPPAYQYQLIMLLPKVDQHQESDYSVTLSQHGLTNEFFSTSCNDYKEKLLDGEFNCDVLTRVKQDVHQLDKLDKWKVQFFEPVYGKSSPAPMHEGTSNVLETASSKCLLPLESSWRTFLKFSENKTDHFAEALTRIKLQVEKTIQVKPNYKINSIFSGRVSAQHKKQRSGVSRLARLPSQKSTFYNSKSSSLHPPSWFQVSLPNSSHGMKCAKAENTVKEKNRWVVKRAQLLRKKAFEKQLKDAKEKMFQDLKKRKSCEHRSDNLGENRHVVDIERCVDDAIESKNENLRSLPVATISTGVVHISIGNNFVVSSEHDTKNSSLNVVTATKTISSTTTSKQRITSGSGKLIDRPSHEHDCDLKKLTENVQRLKNENLERLKKEKKTSDLSSCSSSINLEDALSLKDLIRGSNPFKSISDKAKLSTVTTNNDKKINHSQETVTNAVNSVTSNSDSYWACACKMRAMKECKRCLSLWHMECMNTDMLCLLCSAS